MHIRNLTAALLLIAAAGATQAATVTLAPSAGTVAQNSNFTVNLVLNATDAPGAHPGSFGGAVIVDFSNSLLSYNTFTLAGGVTYIPANGGPVVATNGTTQTVTVAFENALDAGVGGTFSFKAIGAPGSLALIGLVDADDFAGSFVNSNPTNQRFYPTITGTQVNISAVPLPAGGWLLGTAVGALAARRRFRRAGR